MAINLKLATLRARFGNQFALDHNGAINVLQRLGLVSDECVSFDDIASVDAARVLKNWDALKPHLKEAAAQ
jgi:hypothetical protein